MLVRELIAALQQCNPELPVRCESKWEGGESDKVEEMLPFRIAYEGHYVRDSEGFRVGDANGDYVVVQHEVHIPQEPYVCIHWREE